MAGTVEFFMKNCFQVIPDCKSSCYKSDELYKLYTDYISKINKHIVIGKVNFFKDLRHMGIPEKKINGYVFFHSIHKLKNPLKVEDDEKTEWKSKTSVNYKCKMSEDHISKIKSLYCQTNDSEYDCNKFKNLIKLSDIYTKLKGEISERSITRILNDMNCGYVKIGKIKYFCSIKEIDPNDKEEAVDDPIDIYEFHPGKYNKK